MKIHISFLSRSVWTFLLYWPTSFSSGWTCPQAVNYCCFLCVSNLLFSSSLSGCRTVFQVPGSWRGILTRNSHFLSLSYYAINSPHLDFDDNFLILQKYVHRITRKQGRRKKVSIGKGLKMDLSRGSFSHIVVLHLAELVLVECCCCCCRHTDILHHKVFRVILPTE